MPIKPKLPCRQPGCPALVDRGGYCEKHRKASNNRYNKDRRADPSRSDAFYSSAVWRRLRAAHLSEYPLCVECEAKGRTVAATIVDHKTPIKQGGAPLDPENLQSLCNPCHSRKSALEGSRWGQP